MSLSFIDRQRTFVFGRLAVAFYIISLLGLGWIGFSYNIFLTESLSFGEYALPVLFILIFGLTGLTLAFASGGLRFNIVPLQPTLILTGILGIAVVIGLNVFTNIFTNLIAPELQSSILFDPIVPLVVSVAFFGFVGVQEEAFWSGLYIFLKRLFPRATIPIIILTSLGGMAFHQAVAKTLYGGTIFSAPEFFIWIGLSWVLYRLILELTGNIGVSMITHFTWNVGVTLVNLGL